MYVIELAFDDRPERLEARPAHRERLQELHAAGRLVMAGPYADDSGALLVFDVTEQAELDRIIDADPYYRAPGVTVVRRQAWSPIVGT
jgi:uncharacterized protein YciI